jgi:metal-responsive CopG/Arc/MetJ family transcriptional regulator
MRQQPRYDRSPTGLRRVQFSVNLLPGVVEALDEVAEREERSRSFIIERALRAYVESLPTFNQPTGAQ